MIKNNFQLNCVSEEKKKATIKNSEFNKPGIESGFRGMCNVSSFEFFSDHLHRWNYPVILLNALIKLKKIKHGFH